MNKIELFYEDIQPLKLRKNHIKKYINLLIKSELKITGDITIIFCSDKYLLDVNIKYLKHN